jgi:hypothetical protein
MTDLAAHLRDLATTLARVEAAPALTLEVRAEQEEPEANVAFVAALDAEVDRLFEIVDGRL